MGKARANAYQSDRAILVSNGEYCVRFAMTRQVRPGPRIVLDCLLILTHEHVCTKSPHHIKPTTPLRHDHTLKPRSMMFAKALSVATVLSVSSAFTPPVHSPVVSRVVMTAEPSNSPPPKPDPMKKMNGWK